MSASAKSVKTLQMSCMQACEERHLSVERSDLLHFIKREVFKRFARGGSGDAFFYCFALFIANRIIRAAAIEPDA